MTTANPPTTPNILSLREIWSAIRVSDTSVLKTFIICATVAVLGVVGGLVAVALTAGDVTALGGVFSNLITGAIGAVAGAKWAQRKGNNNGAQSSGNG
jgi:uncharacterized membrane protein YeaQ/YmgE (transglycosylase-associated protein family)